jgi:hypothetical protein
MNRTVRTVAILSADDLKNEIVTEIKNSQDGFVPLMQAAKWLSHYPIPIKVAYGSPQTTSLGGPEQATTLIGFYLLSEELGKRDGPGSSDFELADTSYRRGGTSGTEISIQLIMDVATTNSRLDLVSLIRDTRNEQLALLSDGKPPAITPTAYEQFHSPVPGELYVDPLVRKHFVLPEERVINLANGTYKLRFRQTWRFTAGAIFPPAIALRLVWDEMTIALNEKKNTGEELTEDESNLLRDYTKDMFFIGPCEYEHKGSLWHSAKHGEVTIMDFDSEVPFLLHPTEIKYGFEVGEYREEMIGNLGVRIEDFKKFAQQFQIKVVIEGEPEAVAVQPSTVAKRVAKQAQPTQEAIILKWLTDNGYQPNAIPKPPPGTAGVKADAMLALVRMGTDFGTDTIFKKAWERLRRDSRVADA